MISMIQEVAPRLVAGESALLVVDLQEKLIPAMDDAESRLAAAIRMIRAARILRVPTLITEQYPAGLGRTAPAVRDALGDAPAIEKMCFTACGEPVQQRLRERGAGSVIVIGIEAHVCVQQTVLDLLRQRYRPYVCADAVTSRRPLDRETALGRMRQAGAIITTTESVMYEIMGEAGTETFKQILKIVR
jgi:nicotinamidase-related amidase